MSAAERPDTYIGQPIKRREDERLITGRGHYAGDIQLDNIAHLALYRSPLPHARINGVETDAARGLPGVLAVWTADDLGDAASMREQAPHGLEFRDRPVLASGEVNYVGDAILAVVADDPYIAQDAVQQAFVDVDPLPGAGDVLTAMAERAPLVHADMPSNVTGNRTTAYGDIEAAFGGDAVVVEQRLIAARVAGASMEPRTVTAHYDSETGKLRVWTSTQAVFTVRSDVADAVGIDEEMVEVTAEDVGGGFGEKGPSYPEEILAALASKRLNRPVRWAATRTEHTATTVQGHGSVFDMAIAADRDGKLRGFRGTLHHDLGAYVGSAANQPGVITQHMISAYVIPAFSVEHSLVYTNSVPAGYIRGGGRPIGNFVIERMMDLLARRLEMDPVELRRRNLIPSAQMPYDTHLPAGRGHTVTYDSGDYAALLNSTAEAIEWESTSSGERDGRLIGKAAVCCVESTGFGGHEPGRIKIDRSGEAHVYVGSSPQGQAHQTMAAQVVADRLGWPLEKIAVTAGDTRWVSSAMVTAGSRSAIQVGNAAAKAARAARQQLLEHAAERLHVYPSDVVLEDGYAAVRGVPDSRVQLSEVIPEEGIDVHETFDPDMPIAWSSGCHAAVVSVDPETGHVDVLRYVIACDNGRSINPLVVEGQLHGGFAHGLGYALFEEAIYQPDGNFVTASFLDYTIVGAPEVTAIPKILKFETRTPANPEGFKGVGESGTIPVPAAIAGAVEDALRSRDPEAVVDRIPITPQRVHQLLQSK